MAVPVRAVLRVREYQGSETKYDSARFLETSNAKVTDNRVLLGLKLHIGDRTLQQTDRAGATLDIQSPLANPTAHGCLVRSGRTEPGLAGSPGKRARIWTTWGRREAAPNASS